MTLFVVGGLFVTTAVFLVAVVFRLHQRIEILEKTKGSKENKENGKVVVEPKKEQLLTELNGSVDLVKGPFRKRTIEHDKAIWTLDGLGLDRSVDR